MALGDLTQAVATASATSGNLTTPTLGSGATAGNLLIFSAARSSTHTSGGAWPAVSGFTLLYSTAANTGNMAGAWWYKIAAGGETTVSLSGETNAAGNWTAALSEWDAPTVGWNVTPLDEKQENTAGLSATATSISTNTTASTSVAEALALALFCVDSGNSLGTPSYTNSFTTGLTASSGARAAHVVAKKVLSVTGTQETTITINTADEIYASIAVFSADAGDPPTVTLDTTDATAFTTLTPTLLFTGTDADLDDIFYEIQISNNAAFSDSGITLTFEHDSGTGIVHPNPVGSLVNNGTTADGNQQVDDRPGGTVEWGGGILDHIDVRLGRDETDTDGTALVRVYEITGTPGTDAGPAGYSVAADTPTDGWLAESNGIPLNATMPTVNDWYTFDFSGAQRIQTITNDIQMVIVDWVPNGTSEPGSNTIQVLVGNTAAGHNGWIDGSVGANFGVQTFGPKVRVYEDQDIPINVRSDIDPGFANQDNGGDTSPFTSGNQIGYTVQSALTEGIIYYWRVRGSDGAAFGDWSAARTFTVSSVPGTGNRRRRLIMSVV